MRTVLALFSYGGLEEPTIDAVLGELSWCSTNQKNVAYHRISGDALIERSRSRAVGKFLKTDSDVMVMIDHDMEWRPGDMYHVAEQAFEKNALVGGLYSKRAMGRGWSSRVPIDGEVEFGKPGLVETQALATGFMAIPRTVVEGVLEQLDITREVWPEKFKAAVDAKDHELISTLQDLSIAPIADGAYRKVDFEYHDYFRCIRANSQVKDSYQFLSEDWSFAVRANHCGFKSYISTKPILIHHGNYGYTIRDGMDDRDRAVEDGKKSGPGNNPPKNQRAGRNKGKLRK